MEDSSYNSFVNFIEIDLQQVSASTQYSTIKSLLYHFLNASIFFKILSFCHFHANMQEQLYFDAQREGERGPITQIFTSLHLSSVYPAIFSSSVGTQISYIGVNDQYQHQDDYWTENRYIRRLCHQPRDDSRERVRPEEHYEDIAAESFEEWMVVAASPAHNLGVEVVALQEEARDVHGEDAEGPEETQRKDNPQVDHDDVLVVVVLPRYVGRVEITVLLAVDWRGREAVVVEAADVAEDIVVVEEPLEPDLVLADRVEQRC